MKLTIVLLILQCLSLVVMLYGSYEAIRRMKKTRPVPIADCKVWNPAVGKVMEIQDISLRRNKLYTKAGDSEIESGLDECVMLRFTNKKDMEGSTLYEGDIVESQDGCQLIVIKYGVHQEYCPADKCFMDSVGFYAVSMGYPEMPIGNTEDYAIKIGNIYENPELVERQLLEQIAE